MSDFMTNLMDTVHETSPNVSVTENGAVGFSTSGKALTDLNYMLSSMRNMEKDEIWQRFVVAYNENPMLAVLWLFFARDCREGCGERRTFRIIFERFCRENPGAAEKLLPLLPFYGRWDDLTGVFFGDVPCAVRDAALTIIRKTLASDMDALRDGKPVSLLAKWLPSGNTSSPETRRKALRIISSMNLSPRRYRKVLSALRRRIDIAEAKMSAGEWSSIDYSAVPSRAAMVYRDAFARHDRERYDAFLSDVRSGASKINAGVLFPYDIVHAYQRNSRHRVDETLEEQWKALPNMVPANQSTLVVVDGSGSMCASVGNSGVTCLDVAYSLGIYFADKLSGPYYNRFITFSSQPQYVSFADGLTLRAKLDIMDHYADCTNTNIEKVFGLILETAVKHRLKQEDIPANILIITDGEFDSMTTMFDYYGAYEHHHADKALFDVIRNRWEAFGYQLPRLVFWNVCSRTGTIPLTTNDRGVALVSGFSPNIADMVMSGELDPYKCLVTKLMSDRYKPVQNALKE